MNRSSFRSKPVLPSRAHLSRDRQKTIPAELRFCHACAEHQESSNTNVPAHCSQVRQTPTRLKTVNAELDVELFTAQGKEVFQKAIHFLFQLKKLNKPPIFKQSCKTAQTLLQLS